MNSTIAAERFTARSWHAAAPRASSPEGCAALDWHTGYRAGLSEGAGLMLLLVVAAFAIRRVAR